VATVLAGLRCNSATVEVMVCNENGLEVFGGCAASVTGRVSSPTPYGTDLRREPIEVRKATFASLLRLASRYVSGRSPDWLKFKNPRRPEEDRRR